MNEVFKLHAHIAYAKGRKHPNRKGFEVNSVAIMRFGCLTLGSIKLAGKYSEEQVLREWSKSKSGFTLTAQGREFLSPSLAV